MKKFLALYMAPVSTLEEWAKTDPGTRKATEEKMKAEWQAWMGAHAAQVTETAGLGSTMRTTKEGTLGTKNGIMLYSMVEADSIEDATKYFEHHPHLEIPGASIEIMPVNPLAG
ncbi:MAG: hypothetical protein WDN10_01030 [bacterium]